MTDQERIDLKQMRREIFLTAWGGGITHLASAYSVAELMYVLYHRRVLRFDPQRMDDPDRDRLILSKGHAGLALYSAMADAGIIGRERLKTFLQPGGSMGGEPVYGAMPGIEASTGSLGHGLSMGLGMALAGQMDHRDYRTYVIVGDGELQEGSNWEAVMAAHRYGLDKLIVILDRNRIQKMGFIDQTMKIDEWEKRFSSFGWDVMTVADGHDLDQIEAALRAENTSGEPRLIILETVKGKGVSVMENNPAWHFKLPAGRDLKKFMAELDITQEELDACRKHI